nr:disease resistance protein At4g27190-like [Tanacetum cinerariifolium]
MAEVLIGCAANLIAKIGEKVIAETGRHLGYVLYYKNYIESLKQQVEKLNVTSKGITIQVEDAKRNGEVIAPEVDQWFRNVEVVSDDSKKFLSDEVQERNSLWNGWLPNIKKRYMLSKKAKKKTEMIAALKSEVPNKISYQAPPPAVGDISSGDFKNFESREPTITQLMNLLKDDTKQIISICGMGGSGKTTMVKEVARRVEAEKMFDEIIMAVVSKEHDLMTVQEDLAKWLGLRFKMRTQEGRAHELWKRLLQSKKGNLVILDDVWKHIDLKSIGIPFGKEYNNCKIILTSRSKDACKAMGCHDILTLDILTESETWSLLGEMVGDSLQNDPELTETASEIAKRCGGLPIAVVCLGRALKDKRKEVWNDTLKKLQSSMVPANIEGVKEDVYQSLQVSYDLLEDLEAKKVFLLCCLYPEYANVSLEALVRCGVGLDLYRGIDFLIHARDRVHALTDKLRSRYLLLNGDRKSTVKVHSVVRAVGISVASMLEQNLGQFSAAVIHEDRWPRGMTYGNYNAVSVVSNEISELPSRGLIFHKLELLQLACPKLSLENINIMFERMKTVKVVELWNMSLFSLSSFLDSLPRNVLALCMNCKMENIGDIKAEEFENLEILSFGNCDIIELPWQIGKFTNLRLLDMSGCHWLERISPGVISSLSQLEELDTGSKLWGDEEEGDASLAELDSLTNLIYLGIRIKSISFLPRNSLFEKLQRYVIYVGVHLEKSRSFNNRMLLLKLDSTDTHIGGGIDKLLRKNAEKVFLTGDGIKTALKELVPGGFQLVKTLTVESCNNEGVEYLSDRSYSSNASGVFSSLEKLRMDKMWHLKRILRHDDQGLPVRSFSKLRNIHLSVLPEMAHLFNLTVAMNLVHLESLHIEYCTIMQQVIDNPSPSEPRTTENKLIFPKLTKLVLNDIISLVCFSQGINLQVEFPLLKVLKLEYLQSFHTFCPEEINLTSKVNYKGVNFQSLVDHKVEVSSLAELTVTNVGNIKEVWCGHIPNLVHLQGLYIQFCHMMEEVISIQRPSVTTHEERIVFLKLKEVILFGLNRLTFFCRGIDHVDFPHLRVLRLRWLTHFKTFCSEETVDRPSSVFNDKVMLPSLETLEVSELDSVEELCLEKLEVEKCDSLEEVWASKAAPTRNLKNVLVYECPKLGNLCSSDTFKDIYSCKMMEAVVADDHKDVKINGVLSLNKLEEVKLEFLQNLNYFSDTKCDLELPELTRVIVKNCPEMRSFSESSVITPKLKFAVVDGVNTRLGDLNKTVQHSSWEY